LQGPETSEEKIVNSKCQFDFASLLSSLSSARPGLLGRNAVLGARNMWGLVPIHVEVTTHCTTAVRITGSEGRKAVALEPTRVEPGTLTAPNKDNDYRFFMLELSNNEFE